MTFEVERFEWAADDRLEVVGRWFGLRGHRFLRPTLDVEVGGRAPAHAGCARAQAMGARGGRGMDRGLQLDRDPAKLDEAELTVSPDLAVQLPLPDGRRLRR